MSARRSPPPSSEPATSHLASRDPEDAGSGRRATGATVAASNARCRRGAPTSSILADPLRRAPPIVAAETRRRGRRVRSSSTSPTASRSGRRVPRSTRHPRTREAIAGQLPDGARGQGIQHALRLEPPGRSDHRRRPASTASSPATTTTRRRRSLELVELDRARSGRRRARSCAPDSWRASPFSTWPSTSRTAGPGSRAGSSSGRRRRPRWPLTMATDTEASARHTETVSIPVARLNHAVLYVRDATQAAAFYGRVFGFEVVESAFGGRAVFMRSASGENHHDLGLFSVGPDAPRPPRGSVGLYHLAWEVPTIDDLAGGRTRPVRSRRTRRRVGPRRVASRSTAPTPTATNSRSCGASRARRGASTSTRARSCRSTSRPKSNAGDRRAPHAPEPSRPTRTCKPPGGHAPGGFDVRGSPSSGETRRSPMAELDTAKRDRLHDTLVRLHRQGRRAPPADQRRRTTSGTRSRASTRPTSRVTTAKHAAARKILAAAKRHDIDVDDDSDVVDVRRSADRQAVEPRP